MVFKYFLFPLFVLLFLLVPNSQAAIKRSKTKKVPQKKEAPAKASSDTLKFIDFFLKTPIYDLPPNLVPDFMEIDPESLPKNKKKRYLAKKEELLALRKIAEGKKKPPLRRLGLDDPKCDDTILSTMERVGFLSMAGYHKTTEDEIVHTMKVTKCTECELETEFTLQVEIIPNKIKKKPPKIIYMLHDKDPLWAIIGPYRKGDEKPFGTAFFGLGAPRCR